MLQIDTQPFASDAIEDAMRLAQVKALNSFSWSDCFNYLNYAWSDIYNRMANIDSGYYSITVQLRNKLTKIPPFVKSTVHIYTAQRPVGCNRLLFKESSMSDLQESYTYHISGNDLYCPSVDRMTVWLEYVPQAPLLFFTMYNRDPEILKLKDEEKKPKRNSLFKIKQLHCYDKDEREIFLDTEDLSSVSKIVLEHRGTHEVENISEFILRPEEEQFALQYITCDFPYIFVTYKHLITEEYLSGFFTNDYEFVEYNPFAFTGRGSNVEYIDAHWNDKTGLYVDILDHNDGQYKRLGWTPDTKLIYPCPEMYRFLVARLADKFAALNSSNIMGVQKELLESQYAFEAFLEKDKSSFKRIENVTGPTIDDYL